MKNILRVTIVLALLAATGSTTKPHYFSGPGPQCGPILCPPAVATPVI